EVQKHWRNPYRTNNQEPGMINFERAREIDATPDAVWAVLGRYMHIDEFAPLITSVDALSEGADGLGSKCRNNFENGTSVVETVTEWKPGQGFTVELSDMAAMPLKGAKSGVFIMPIGDRSEVIWTFNYRVKYGPLGWLMGLMKMMMGKIIEGNLKGLADKVTQSRTS
ncbi:MAG: SRPBCC family protein, partial [Hyphomicrobiales bacterium]